MTRRLLLLSAISTCLLAVSLSSEMAQAIPGMPTTVARWKGADVFASGQPLFDGGGRERLARLMTVRRDAPGSVELHLRDTDVLCVLRGSAQLVTGGSVVGQRELSATEVGGSAIANGESWELGPGDVAVVPRGTPHWFQTVRGSVEYATFKISDASLPASAIPDVAHWQAEVTFPNRSTFLADAGYLVGQVSAVRRDQAGHVESHTVDTDILFVVDGAATLVTGGSIVDERSAGTDQLTGSSILDGVTRHVGKGDIVVVPRRTPHAFTAITGTLQYVAMKAH